MGGIKYLTASALAALAVGGYGANSAMADNPTPPYAPLTLSLGGPPYPAYEPTVTFAINAYDYGTDPAFVYIYVDTQACGGTPYVERFNHRVNLVDGPQEILPNGYQPVDISDQWGSSYGGTYYICAYLVDGAYVAPNLSNNFYDTNPSDWNQSPGAGVVATAFQSFTLNGPSRSGSGGSPTGSGGSPTGSAGTPGGTCSPPGSHSADVRTQHVRCNVAHRVIGACKAFSYGHSGTCEAAGRRWYCRSRRVNGTQSTERCTSSGARVVSWVWLD